MEQADLDFQRKPVTKSQALEFTEFSIKCKKKITNFGALRLHQNSPKASLPVESEASAIDASMICLPPETCFCVGICKYLETDGIAGHLQPQTLGVSAAEAPPVTPSNALGMQLNTEISEISVCGSS